MPLRMKNGSDHGNCFRDQHLRHHIEHAMLNNCRLCGQMAALQESHILPAFVFKWLKETSATGFLRFGQEPNKRVQDGMKRNWLCSPCETRLNLWETQFATNIFHPVNDDDGPRVEYGDCLLKFCASI